MADRAIGLAPRAEAAASFLAPEIAALSDETIADWIAQEPGLEPYRHALTRITRQRAHIRSTEVEEILARAGEMAAASEITQSVLEDGELPLGQITDESGRTVRLAQGNLQPLPRLRQPPRAAGSLGAVGRRLPRLPQHLRRHPGRRGQARRLLRPCPRLRLVAGSGAGRRQHPARGLLTTCVDTVWKHFPVWHRYFNVRRRLLGLPEGDLHGYDLEAPLAEQPSFPWERGRGDDPRLPRAAGAGVRRRSAPRHGGALD